MLNKNLADYFTGLAEGGIEILIVRLILQIYQPPYFKEIQ